MAGKVNEHVEDSAGEPAGTTQSEGGTTNTMDEGTQKEQPGTQADEQSTKEQGDSQAEQERMLHADYTKKTQALAEEKRQLQAAEQFRQTYEGDPGFRQVIDGALANMQGGKGENTGQTNAYDSRVSELSQDLKSLKSTVETKDFRSDNKDLNEAEITQAISYATENSTSLQTAGVILFQEKRIKAAEKRGAKSIQDQLKVNSGVPPVVGGGGKSGLDDQSVPHFGSTEDVVADILERNGLKAIYEQEKNT